MQSALKSLSTSWRRGSATTRCGQLAPGGPLLIVLGVRQVLSELIHHARPSCDTSVSEHVNRYRLLREARPTWQPGWLERTELQLSKSTHERVIRNAHSQIDNQAPGAAIHFRKVLNDSRYTRGGVMRRSEPMPRRRRRGRATSSMSEPEMTHAGPMDSATVPRTRKMSGEHDD